MGYSFRAEVHPRLSQRLAKTCKNLEQIWARATSSKARFQTEVANVNLASVLSRPLGLHNIPSQVLEASHLPAPIAQPRGMGDFS